MVMEIIALINGLLDQKVRQAKDTYKLLIAGTQNGVVNCILKTEVKHHRSIFVADVHHDF